MFNGFGDLGSVDWLNVEQILLQGRQPVHTDHFWVADCRRGLSEQGVDVRCLRVQWLRVNFYSINKAWQCFCAMRYMDSRIAQAMSWWGI